MNDVSRIWYILYEAVMGKIPVYGLARHLVGLDKDTIMDIAQKIHDDMHTSDAEISKEIQKQKTRKFCGFIAEELAKKEL